MINHITSPLVSYNTRVFSCGSSMPKRKNITNINKFANYDMALANINRARISFGGYYGDQQPSKKLFWVLTGRNDIYEDNWTKEHFYIVNDKRWVNAPPNELLKRSPEQVIQAICTITKPDNQYPGIPSCIMSPNYGDKWGRYANYIEINPRLVAKYDNGKITEGLFGVMKLLPAIPPSSKRGANCILLSQLYPDISGDGSIYGGSLYCANLHSGISKNLTSDWLIGKVGEDEQVKAFNDLSHLLGFKTGIRMPLSAGQMRVKNGEFDWFYHEKAFIDACIWAVELGFDAIYFDSGKHVIDGAGYVGIGALPNDKQLAYILYQIRNQTGRGDLSFIGEKCNDNYRYKELGLTAGTDWGNADNIFSVKYEAKKQAWSREYAAGPEVSNDNDDGSLRFEDRLNRLNSCLWGFENGTDKLPAFLQLHDIFPLSPYLNTHEAMMRSKEMRGSDAWTECERHWDGVFNTSQEANDYRNAVYQIFANNIRY